VRQGGLLQDGKLKPIRGERQLLDAFGKAGLALAAARDVNPWRLFWTLYRQQDGQGLLDDAKALTALRLLQKIGATARFTDNNAAGRAVRQRPGGFFWNGEWELPTFQEQHPPFDVAPFPQIYDRPAATPTRTRLSCRTNEIEIRSGPPRRWRPSPSWSARASPGPAAGTFPRTSRSPPRRRT